MCLCLLSFTMLCKRMILRKIFRIFLMYYVLIFLPLKDVSQNWCVVCYHHEETNDHILQYKYMKRKALRENAMSEISEYFSKTGTPKAMHYCNTNMYLAWLQGDTPLPLSSIAPNASTTLKLAYATQHKIGWSQFF